MADMRNLQRRALTFYAVQAVPRKLQAIVGKRLFVKSLGTRDYHAARRLCWGALNEFAGIVAAAQGGSDSDALEREAMEWRRLREASPAEDLREYVADASEAIEERHGLEKAKQFHAIASGRATPLLHHMEDWLREGGAKGPVAPKTASQYRADLERLRAWAANAGAGATVEAFTNRVAGRFVTETLVARGVGATTANRKITAASSYWRWLIKRGVAEANPWANQSISKGVQRSDDGGRKSRAYADDELAALLTGATDPLLYDLTRMAALTGARLAEILALTVADCARGSFRITKSKTVAGRRTVPTHSALVDIVAKNVAGKVPTDRLLNAPSASVMSKRFTRLRRSLDLDDRREGQRRSLLTLHSLRNWFTTKARHGFDKAVVDSLTGHAQDGITDRVYNAGPTDARMRECVESVRLPVVPHSTPRDLELQP